MNFVLLESKVFSSIMLGVFVKEPIKHIAYFCRSYNLFLLAAWLDLFNILLDKL